MKYLGSCPSIHKLLQVAASYACMLIRGRVAELVYAHDSKSCSFGIEGSIPSSSTNQHIARMYVTACRKRQNENSRIQAVYSCKNTANEK